MLQKNILVADDDRAVLDLLEEILKREGYRVLTVSNGIEAVEAAKRNSIDVAVLDIKMPFMDGIEALKGIKAIDPSIEVLIITGYADLDSLRKAIVEHGAFDYLIKPFNRTGIVHTIQNALMKKDPILKERLFEKEQDDLVARLEEDFKEKTRQLRESQIKYRDIIEKSNDMIVVVQDGNLRFANLKTLALTGYKEEILNMPILDLIHPEDRPMVLETYNMWLQGKDSSSIQVFRVLKKNGESIWVELNVVGTMWEERPATLNFIRDISVRKRAEDALRESEAQKRALLDASEDRIRFVDKDMKIIWGNKTTALVHGISPEDLVGKTCYEAFVGRNSPCEGCATVKARETGRIERAEIFQPEVKGIKEGTYWDTYCVPLKDRAGKIDGFIQVARNITISKLAEERIHTLSQQLLKAQENERQRISRYMHDHVAQDLSTLKIGIKTLFDDQPEASQPEIMQRLSKLSEILQGTITAVRGLAYDLSPPGLDQLGLVQALFQSCEDFSEKSGVECNFYCAGMDGLRLSSDIEINMYRLVQEGLNNVKKHAEANHVVVRLVASYPSILLRIEDDGKGFDVEGRLHRASKEKRMGLGSMEERVSLLNGSLKVQSCLMEGTKIFIEIPFKEKKNG